MSHHYSGPDFGFPHGDARLDLTDLYAFAKPGEADKSILIMNVHPSAVVIPPGFTTREPFAPEALYELKIDTNGDAIADSKHADQPAAKSCSGLVPVPGLPGRDSLTSRRPSELRDMPVRPPVVWAFAVYSTFSSLFITSSFVKSAGAWTPATGVQWPALWPPST